MGRPEKDELVRAVVASPCCHAGLTEHNGDLRCCCCGHFFQRYRGTPLLHPPHPRSGLRFDLGVLAARGRQQALLRRRGLRKLMRRLARPPMTASWFQRRRIREFLQSLGPGAVVIDLGASEAWIGPQVITFDLVPAPDIDIAGDIHDLPLRDGCADAIICTGVLEHVADPALAVAEIERVLKPGGALYLSVPFLQGMHGSPTDFQRFTRDGLRRLLRRFEQVEVIPTRGGGSTVAWLLRLFLANLLAFNSPTLYRVNLALFGWLLSPLRFLDSYLVHTRWDFTIASGFTAHAHKPWGAAIQPGREPEPLTTWARLAELAMPPPNRPG